MKRPRVGYAFYGFLGDHRIVNRSLVSTPDGNFFYSWAIINALRAAGYDVVRLMPDKDVEAYTRYGRQDFAAFASDLRHAAYSDLGSFSRTQMPDVDAVLLEWRWAEASQGDRRDGFEIQEEILAHYAQQKIIGFDLDYHMTEHDDTRVGHVIELGFKRGTHVDIPFDISTLCAAPLHAPTASVVYVGNRYERDWAVEKYLAPAAKLCNVVAYGNWTERDRDSVVRWPQIKFGPRIHPSQFATAYADAAVVPLLAKDEYCRFGFMTARILEALFYGAMPVLIDEFVTPIDYHIPCVHSGDEIAALAQFYAQHPVAFAAAITKAREQLEFMDAQYFVKTLQRIID